MPSKILSMLNCCCHYTYPNGQWTTHLSLLTAHVIAAFALLCFPQMSGSTQKNMQCMYLEAGSLTYRSEHGHHSIYLQILLLMEVDSTERSHFSFLKITTLDNFIMFLDLLRCAGVVTPAALTHILGRRLYIDCFHLVSYHSAVDGSAMHV
ncbi:hypothetical protein B0T13DRAFT_142885 [Neurospora crassa]|nr:hypothetical protein B0T13DRAFT_142885 [Neurospora crassa]